jgi:Icc-related predicted phosphoesterase
MPLLRSRFRRFFPLCLSAALLACFCCNRSSSAQSNSVDLQTKVDIPFRFVAYGDTRFHDPKDEDIANPMARRALVQAIAEANPAFICFTGDIVFNGYDSDDWKVWDSETGIWRDRKITVYPALGNHDLRGDLKADLANYFQRFPDLKNSRYYSVRAANTLLLVLDSSQDEVSGSQGKWLVGKLDNLPPDVDFVLLMLHHPPYTSAPGGIILGMSHTARPSEKKLAEMLESRQPHTRARFIVFAGHVHNYERHEHGGVTYFVSGGGGAKPLLFERPSTDLFQSNEINYHYLLVEVDRLQLKVTMNRLDLTNGKAEFTQSDIVKIGAPAPSTAPNR